MKRSAGVSVVVGLLGVLVAGCGAPPGDGSVPAPASGPGPVLVAVPVPGSDPVPGRTAGPGPAKAGASGPSPAAGPATGTAGLDPAHLLRLEAARTRLQEEYARIDAIFGSRASVMGLVRKGAGPEDLDAWSRAMADPGFVPAWTRYLDRVAELIEILPGIDLARVEAALPERAYEVALLIDRAIVEAIGFILAGAHYPDTFMFKAIASAGIFDVSGMVEKMAETGTRVKSVSPAVMAAFDAMMARLAQPGRATPWLFEAMRFGSGMARGRDPGPADVGRIAGMLAADRSAVVRFALMRSMGVALLVPPGFSTLRCDLRNKVLGILAAKAKEPWFGLPRELAVPIYDEALLGGCEVAFYCAIEGSRADLDAFDGLLDAADREGASLRPALRPAAEVAVAMLGPGGIAPQLGPGPTGRLVRFAASAGVKLPPGFE